MKIMKHITVEQDVAFCGLTLLSKDNYEAFVEHIPHLNGWWWLCSQGSNAECAFCVKTNNELFDMPIDCDGVLVRPALILVSDPGLSIGDRFEFDGRSWTVISDCYALCDTSYCRMAFRKHYDPDDKNANLYYMSDIIKYLGNEWKRMKEEQYA